MSRKTFIAYGRAQVFARLKEQAKAGKLEFKIIFEHGGPVHTKQVFVDFDRQYFAVNTPQQGWENAIYVYLKYKADIPELTELLTINGFKDKTFKHE